MTNIVMPEVVKINNLIYHTPLAEESSLTKNIRFIDSKFGKIRVDTNKTISFVHGLLGIDDNYHFCLADFPTSNFDNYKILQSLDDTNLSFIVWPLGGVKNSASLIEHEDLVKASFATKTPEKDLAILLITTIHSIYNASTSSNDVKVSVNVRAPLIINCQNYIAQQFVFPNEKYQIKHLIG